MLEKNGKLFKLLGMEVNQSSPENYQSAKRMDTQMRREQIAAAALSLIGQAGLEGLSIVGIATEVGLVPSAIYRHFSGKAAIIDAVNELISERLLGIVRHVCDEETDPIAQLRMLLTLHINLIKTNNGIPRYIFSSEVATDSSGRNHQLYTTVQRYLEKVAAIIRVGQHTGRIRPELEANILAYMFLGLLQPAIFLNHLSDGQFDIETETQRAWQVFSQSILATAD